MSRLFFGYIIVNMKVILDIYTKSTIINSDTIAVADYKKDKKKGYGKELEDLDKNFSGLIKEHILMEEFDFSTASTLSITVSKTSKVSSKFKSIKRIIVLGLGEKEDDKKTLRKSYAALTRACKSNKTEKLLAWFLPNPELLTETMILVAYEFTKYKSKKDSSNKDKKLSELKILSDAISAQDKKKVKNAQIIAESTYIARDLVWEPASVLTPTYLANEAKQIDQKIVPVTIKEANECKKLGMGSFLAVAQGSDQPPKFIEFNYQGNGKTKKHIVLIGKGVTFDSGGLSLKPAKAMEMMKEDMAGAAAIIAIMNAISKLQPSGLQITAIIAATENMPSGKAYKPGDVITAMNGKTIEVNNTDAEGRLTLADAVAYASNKNPDEIIDFATLTGACTVALGNVCAGLMGNDQDLINRLKTSAENTGELVWQLPLYDEYKSGLKSTIADLINAGSGGKAGAQNGALFIQEFVGKQKISEKQIPWAHIDIAGPCWFEQEMDWSPKGASGTPVRMILDYLLNI